MYSSIPLILREAVTLSKFLDLQSRRLRALVDTLKQPPDRLEISDNRVSLYVAGEKRGHAALKEIESDLSGLVERDPIGYRG